MKRGVASLTASPNPVPDGAGLGATRITWSTGDGSMGQVYVAEDGGAERLFVEGPEGSQDAPWIGADAVYTFRLYAGTERRILLATVVVTRGSELVEALVDALIVLALATPVILLLTGAYYAFRRIPLALRR